MSEITDKYGLPVYERPSPQPYVPPANVYNPGERDEDDGGKKKKPGTRPYVPPITYPFPGFAPTMADVRRYDAGPSYVAPASWLGQQVDLYGRPLGVSNLPAWMKRQVGLGTPTPLGTTRPATFGGLQAGMTANEAFGWGGGKEPAPIYGPPAPIGPPAPTYNQAAAMNANLGRLEMIGDKHLAGAGLGTTSTMLGTTPGQIAPNAGGVGKGVGGGGVPTNKWDVFYKPGGFDLAEIHNPDAKPNETGWLYEETPASFNLAPKGYGSEGMKHVAGYYIWNGKYYPIGGINPNVGVLGANDGSYRNYWGWWNVPRSALPGYSYPYGGGWGGGGGGGGGGKNADQYYNMLINWDI